MSLRRRVFGRHYEQFNETCDRVGRGEDIRELYDLMQTGSGLKNKVPEALGLGVAVVSTARGVEALPAARDGEHLVIAGDAAGFADAVLELLDDPASLLRLRANANALLHERYRWSVAGRPWRALFDDDGPVGLSRQSDVNFLGA